MKNLARFSFVVTCLLLFGASALAESRYRFEAFGAGSFPRAKTFEITVPQSRTPMHGRQEFSAGARGGVRFGTDGSGHWGQDFVWSYGSSSSRIKNEATGMTFAFKDRTHQISYNALWYPGGLRRKNIFPYLTAGVGGTLHSLPQETINEALDPNRGGLGKLRSENVFAFNAGAGVRMRINSLYGLRIDVRDYVTRAVRYGLPKASPDPAATVFPIGGLFHQVEVSFAFVYYFR